MYGKQRSEAYHAACPKCMSLVAVGRSLTIVSDFAFKMAALWFWTLFNCNPPIAHYHPLLWGGGILVDHWSTISSLFWHGVSVAKATCDYGSVQKLSGPLPFAGDQWMHATGFILCMCPANERRRYIVTSSLIGWAHIQYDPWHVKCYLFLRYGVMPPHRSSILWVPAPEGLSLCPVIINLITIATGKLTHCSLWDFNEILIK